MSSSVRPQPLYEGAIKLSLATGPAAPSPVHLKAEKRYLKLFKYFSSDQYEVNISEKKSSKILLCSQYSSFCFLISGKLKDVNDGIFGSKKKTLYLACVTRCFTFTLYDSVTDKQVTSDSLAIWKSILSKDHERGKCMGTRLLRPLRPPDGKPDKSVEDHMYLVFMEGFTLIISSHDNIVKACQRNDSLVSADVRDLDPADVRGKDGANSKAISLYFKSETYVLECTSDKVPFVLDQYRSKVPDVISSQYPRRDSRVSIWSSCSSVSASSNCEITAPAPHLPKRHLSLSTLNPTESKLLKNYLAVTWSQIDTNDYVNWCAKNSSCDGEDSYGIYDVIKWNDEYTLPDPETSTESDSDVYDQEKSELYWGICNTLEEVLNSRSPAENTLGIPANTRIKLGYSLMVRNDGDWQTLADNLDLTKNAADILLAFVKHHQCNLSLGEIILRHWQFIYNYSVKMNKSELCPVPCTKEGLTSLLTKMERYDLLHLIQRGSYN